MKYDLSGKWMELYNIILNQVTLTKKDKMHFFLLLKLLDKNLEMWMHSTE